MWKLPTIALGLVVALGVVRAAADDVPPPPPTCPAGARGVSGRAGPACVPADCDRDSDCKGGESCREQALCIRTEEYVDRGGLSPEKRSRTVVGGACGAGQTCADPTRCDTRKRCGAAAAPTHSPSAAPGTDPARGPATSGNAGTRPAPTAAPGPAGTGARPAQSGGCAHAGGATSDLGDGWLLALGVAAACAARRRPRVSS